MTREYILDYISALTIVEVNIEAVFITMILRCRVTFLAHRIPNVC